MKIDWTPIILIGGLAVGAYFLMSKIKDILPSLSLPSIPSGEGLREIVAEHVVKPPLRILGSDTPIIPTTPEALIRSPTVLEMAFPPAGIPGFIEQFATDKAGGFQPMAAPIKAAAAVGIAIGAIKTKQTLPPLPASSYPPISQVHQVQVVRGGEVFVQPIQKSLQGLINPKTGIRYMGR